MVDKSGDDEGSELDGREERGGKKQRRKRRGSCQLSRRLLTTSHRSVTTPPRIRHGGRGKKVQSALRSVRSWLTLLSSSGCRIA